MSYNKRTWATGNVVGAVDLNRIENGIADIDVDEIRGWSKQNTQLFSESVTTTDQGGMNMGTLSYNVQITRSSITISFNGVEYEMTATVSVSPMGDVYLYGDLVEGVPDFTTYPFAISSQPNGANYIVTQSAGTYTVVASATGAEVGALFRDAVSSALGGGIFPFLCEDGTTTYDEMHIAQDRGQLMYFYTADHDLCIVGNMNNSPLSIISTNASVSASFDNDNIFTITNY